MPCWEVNLVSVKFNAANRDLIIETLKRMDLNPNLSNNKLKIFTDIGTFNLDTGEVETESWNVPEVNKFKVEYSKTALMLAAKKNKWIVKKRSGKNQFVAKKW
jgi:hypothetical protein